MSNRQRQACRRPIGDAEVPSLERLGAALRAYRQEAGLSAARLARAAEVHPSTVERIEAAMRRTRRSTLRRMAAALASAHPTLDPGRVAADLIAAGGSAIAPESRYAERIARRRTRRAIRLRRRGPSLVQRDRSLLQWARQVERMSVVTPEALEAFGAVLNAMPRGPIG
jgi:transcriptional regulator with XRE-family HTH domain